MSEIYFYGDARPGHGAPGGGHFLYAPSRDGWVSSTHESSASTAFYFSGSGGIPWHERECYDLPPDLQTPPEEMPKAFGGCERQRERCGAVRYRAGWTAFCLWDRSADRRGNSVAIFFAKGFHDGRAMMSLIADRFPRIWQRIAGGKHVVVSVHETPPDPHPAHAATPEQNAPSLAVDDLMPEFWAKITGAPVEVVEVPHEDVAEAQRADRARTR